MNPGDQWPVANKLIQQLPPSSTLPGFSSLELAEADQAKNFQAADPQLPFELPPLPPVSQVPPGDGKPIQPASGYNKSITQVLEPDADLSEGLPAADFRPIEILAGDAKQKQKLEALQNKIDDLEKSGADVFDVLQAKVEKAQEQSSQFHFLDPDPFRQIVKLREQQLVVLDEKMSALTDATQRSQWQQKRNRVRYELGNARTALHEFESSKGIRPYTQPIYENQIYEQWFQTAKQERQIEKLCKAVLSLANLADEGNRNEMFQTVLEIARRGPGVADGVHVEYFDQTMRSIFEMHTTEDFAKLILDELRQPKSLRA